MLKKYFIVSMLFGMTLCGMEEAASRTVEPSVAVSEIPFKKTYFSLLAAEPALLGYIFLLDFFNHEAHTEAAEVISEEEEAEVIGSSPKKQLQNAGFFRRIPRLKQLAARLSSLLKIDETGALVRQSELFSAIPYNNVDAFTLVCDRFAHHDYHCLLGIFKEHLKILNKDPYACIEQFYDIIGLLKAIKEWQEELTSLQPDAAASFKDLWEWDSNGDAIVEELRKRYACLALPPFSLDEKVKKLKKRHPYAFGLMITGNHGDVPEQALNEIATSVFSQSRCFLNWLMLVGVSHSDCWIYLQNYRLLLDRRIDAPYIAAHLPTPQALARVKDYLIKYPRSRILQEIRTIGLETGNDALTRIVDEIAQASHPAPEPNSRYMYYRRIDSGPE